MQGLPSGVVPYCGVAPAPGDLLARWNLDPRLIAVLIFFLGLYVVGLRRVVGGGRGAAKPEAFLVGWTIAVLALVSPLCPLSVSLFSARVGQHMVLTLLAAPLVALGRPGWIMACAFGGPRPRTSRPKGASAVAAAVVFAILLWVWHAPGPYYATFLSSAAYWAMHISLFGAALWLWSELLNDAASPGAIGASVISMLQMGLLGALITLAPRALYGVHAFTTGAWGLSPLHDQQLGGALMWAPGGVAFLAAALASAIQILRPTAVAGAARMRLAAT